VAPPADRVLIDTLAPFLLLPTTVAVTEGVPEKGPNVILAVLLPFKVIFP
jgi:hypothetical protein